MFSVIVAKKVLFTGYFEDTMDYCFEHGYYPGRFMFRNK